ncbi:MAG: hypothetical protein FJY81_05740, partial [Candidatus Aminicenantes bacterium]|nr:hypothetical protein [Candidatus Aminicenantes bacterium]
MTRKKAMLSILGVALALSVALPLRAESRSSGDFLFGFRFVDTSGPGGAYKYKEDINLQGGARLYNFSLAYTPDNGLRRWLDRLDFRMSNFGGDPFESLEATLQKYGRYALKYARKKAAYFYQDLHRPGGGELYDPRQFGFDRVVDGGSAKISLSKRADLTFSFDRFTRTGNSLTTQDIERVEFVLEKPVQEESKEVALGLNVRLNRYAFFFEERRRDYKNENSLFLPGYADGGPGAIYPTSLHLYILNQPYDLQSFTHTLRFSARPFDNLLLAGRALISREEMDLNYSERAEGLDYLGRKLHYGYSGKGTFDRNVQLYDFDLTYVFTKRFSLVGAVRYHRFDQSGALTGEAGAESADIGYDTLAFDAGLQVLLTARLSLAFGYRNETRNLDGLETATYEFETRQQGFFGNIRWDGRALRLTFDYEHRASEEPYTLMSAANFDRMRLTARYRAGKFNLTGTYLWTDSQGEVFEQDFASTKNQL